VSLRFKNLSKLPSDSWQVKFKRDGKSFQPFVGPLDEALLVRNAYYQASLRPNFLFVNAFDSDLVREVTRDERSGNVYTRYQVHCRKLPDRKYAPKSFNSLKDAQTFAEKYLVAYNKVAAVYNGERERAFLKQSLKEALELQPCIETGFNKELWAQSARTVFGNNVPDFYLV
jgi:hypothetical protein